MVAIGKFTEETVMIFTHTDTSYKKVKKKHPIALCVLELKTAISHPAGRYMYEENKETCHVSCLF